jgi:aspartyl/asparaginyl-tRNA synthetase
VISEPIEEIPIDRSNPETYPGLELRLNERHISLREPKISLAFEVQSYADYKLREFGFEN